MAEVIVAGATINRAIGISVPLLVDPDTGYLLVNIAGGAGGGGLTDAELRATPVPIDLAKIAGVAVDTSIPVPVDGDVAHDAVDSGNPIKLGGYAKAAAPTDVSADADRVAAWFLRNGALAVNLTAAGALIPGDATNGLKVQPGGNVAHDAVDSGNPVKIGGKAVSALSAITLVSSADRADASFDIDGALIVRNGGAIGDRVSAVATNTDGTSTSCIAAQASGIKVNLTDVTLCNSSSTNITVDIRDGAAGTVKWTFPVPANGGVTHRFETPISGTAATAWCFDPSTAATTVTCSMAGRLSKV